MKINHRHNNKAKEQLAITTELIDVLRQVNLNSSWKNGSTKFSKNMTGCIYRDNKYTDLMTENDLDRLFNRSKEKQKLKT